MRLDRFMRDATLLSLALATSGGVAVAQVKPAAGADVPKASTVPATRGAAGTALADAAMRGDVARMRALLAQRANANAAQGDGMTALHWAAERGDAEMATLLLRAGASTTATTRIGGYTPLHIASRNGNGAVVKALLAAGAKPSAISETGVTPLHLAATAGDPTAVNALIAAKAEVNARETEWGQTPLVFAASAGRADAVTALLKAGADASLRTRSVDLTEQAAREQLAARKRNETLLALLPQKTRDSLQAAQAKATADAAAAAQAVRAAGGAPAQQQQQQAQPRQMAQAAAGTAQGAAGAGARAAAGVRDSSRGPGAPAAAQAPQGPREAPPTTALTATQIQQAIEAGRQTLLAPVSGPMTVQSDTSDGQVAGFEGTVGSMGGMAALHHAVRQGNAAAAFALLDGGADLDVRTAGDSTTPLLLATMNGHFDLAMELVKRGANVKLASTAGTTPLYAAINSAWLPRSRFPQPQSVQNQRTTHVELMEAILKAGADVNTRLAKNLWFFGYNNCGNANCGLEYLDGSTAFWRAAYSVDVEAMRLLRKYGADATIPAVRAPQTGRRGGGGGGGGGFAPAQPRLAPDIDSAARAVPPGIGVYPIHAASGVGYGNGFAGNSHRHAPGGWMPTVKYLVEELGADVNQRDAQGYTPLHHAAARGDNEMIQYLVSKGADVKAVARNGRTTVDMANGPVQRLRPFPETIALLEKLGAKNSHRCVSC